MLLSMMQTQAERATDRPPLNFLQQILDESAQMHRHLCPRQVLGARIGLLGLRTLGLIDAAYQKRFYNSRKRLLTIVETDGCGADGISVATDSYVGRRTMRVVDYGKVAATLVDIQQEIAVRIWPSSDARDLAERFAPNEKSRWHAYLLGYQLMPDNLLLRVQPVQLTQSIQQIISKPNHYISCASCGEEVMHEREVVHNGRILCQACAGNSYYVT